MKQFVCTLMMFLALAPGYSREQEIPTGQESKIEAAARLVKAGMEMVSGKEGQDAEPAAKEEGGIMDTLGGAISIGKDVLGDKWTGLKDQCAEIKELMAQTFFLVQLLCIGVALFVSLVPLLLIVVVVYLRKINSKLAAIAARE